MNKKKLPLQNHNHWLLGLLILFIFIFVTRSPVSHTGSDPRASLLLSQALIESQSIKLDKYKDANYGYAVQKKNEHYYYYFPIGTSISSIPFVLFKTKILDHNMNNPEHDGKAQKQIAGIVSVLIFLLLYFITRMYFNSGASIVISFVFWMGTSLSSTLGQALWSQDFASLYALLSIFLMLKIVKENKNIYWVFLGTALFMAYLTRPTMSLLSVTVITYLFLNNKKYIAIKTASLVGLLLGLFVLFSLSEFNQLLPDYYLPKRLSSDTFWTALYGNLFSPARGLLIFSPFLFIFFFNPKGIYKVFKDDKTLLIIAAWVVLHLIVISKFPHWWAGWSYGPRFMIDVLPAIFLLLVILLSYSYNTKSLIEKRLVSLFLIVTVPASIYFNAVQGLYNTYAGAQWNASPNIDKNPEYLFDWKYPQFLHNKERHEKRIIEFNSRMAGFIHFNDERVVFNGWSFPEKSHRWSLGKVSTIQLKLPESKNMQGILSLKIGTLGEQEIKLSINDHYIGSTHVNASDRIIKFEFNPKILNIGDSFNTIKFVFPDAHKPDNGDQRILAMALKSFKVE